MKYKKRAVMLLMMLTTLMVALHAQTSITVGGTVTDGGGEPLVGVTVTLKGTQTGAITDLDGKYSMKAPARGTLVFSYVGMTTVSQDIAGKNTINVVMHEDAGTLEGVVVVGYGTQRRGSVTGAVASVKGSEMIQTKTENPQNMLTGRIAGVRSWQKSAEPGSYNNNFDVRGMGSPLVIIDGVPRDMSDFQRMNPNDIADISLLKDASASIYGLRSANGVLLVTTKKGTAGKTKVSYNGSFTIQTPKSMPKLADPYQTMTLFNEMSMNKVSGGSIVYSDQIFEDFRNGTRRTTDWNKLVFAETSPETNHNVSISGGSEKTQYFVSAGYFYQEGFFRSGDLNYTKFNLASNINTEIARGLKGELNISLMADNQHNPYKSSTDIIRNYWAQGVLYPAYADPEGTMLNYEGLDLEENTIADMTSAISGYRVYKQKQLVASGTLTYDFGTLTPVLKGLTAKGMMSYEYDNNDNSMFRKEYYQYAYDPTTKTYNQKLYAPSSPNQLRREHYAREQFLNQLTLNYERAFGPHKVAAVAGMETQRRSGDNFYVMRNLAFSSPYLYNGTNEGLVGNADPSSIYAQNYNAFIGRVNYNYADRYLLEGQFRYDGSSQFAPGHRWGFFPSVSAGWRVSEEPWFKKTAWLSKIEQLKLRASYGKMGDDSGAGYDWVAGFTYPSTSGNADNGYYNQYAPGYILGGKFIYAATPKAIPNEAISWYTSTSFDIGVDFSAWNGLFGFSLDYFDRRTTGLYEYRTSTFPTVIGATPPRENANSNRNFGLELELTHRNKIGQVEYNVKGIVTIARKEWLTAIQQGPYANSYDRWRNDNLTHRYQGVEFGYESAGRFQNWQDIWNYQIYHEKETLPGDYKYLDWNGDGEISSLDEHPFAFSPSPLMNFSLNLEASWKGFDFSCLFQGSALASMAYQEPLYSIWGVGGALTQFLDRWHPKTPNVDPYDPALEWETGHYAFTGHSPLGNSEFNRVDASYVRLKSVEIGYTLPKLKQLPAASLRIFANAYNLLTITGVKFVDPEHPEDDLGRLYPLSKTYTLGLQLSF